MTRSFQGRPDRGEVAFATFAVGLAVGIGAIGPSPAIQVYVLFVIWAGLVGLMIPRLVAAHRDAQALSDARQRESRQRVVNHDMASALLTIEGGVAALRFVYHEGQTHVPGDDAVAARVESIAHAIETEIRRIRRITTSTTNAGQSCSAASTVTPLIALHQASGAHVIEDLGTDERVAMSPDDLARVVANVLDNCVRHAPGASIHVSGFTTRNHYRLCIADNGPGIASDFVDRAFEDGVSSRAGGGLGLYSARSIVETCHGAITIDSSSSGTAVTFELPLAVDELSVDAPSVDAPSIDSLPVALPVESSPLKVATFWKRPRLLDREVA